MTAVHGLNETTVSRICGVLAGFPAVGQAVLFGSRAKGVQKPGSDIDLALYGPDVDWRVLGRIEDALDDLLLPYTFSLVAHNATTYPDLAAHIGRASIPFYNRSGALAGSD